jgi:hypothetical protein
MQGKTHLSGAISNFNSLKETIGTCVKKYEPVSLNNGYFKLGSKGAAITILNKVIINIYPKVFPGARRVKYEIPSKFGRD